MKIISKKYWQDLKNFIFQRSGKSLKIPWRFPVLHWDRIVKLLTWCKRQLEGI